MKKNKVVDEFCDTLEDRITINHRCKDIEEIEACNQRLTLIERINKQYAVNDEIITFEIYAINTGDMPLGGSGVEPIIVYDLLSEEFEFISGSIEIDKVCYKDLGIAEGVNIGYLGVGDSKVITFNARVVANKKSYIEDQARATFGFIVPGNREPHVSSAVSNIAKLYIEIVYIEVNKESDKSFVVLEDTITYKVDLKNNGTVDANNVIFKDILKKEVELIQGSFKVNDKVIHSVKLESGVNIGDILVNKNLTIKYTVKVINSNSQMKIRNCANAEFYYVLPDGSTGSSYIKTTKRLCDFIDVGISNFKQLSIEEYINISNKRPEVNEINNVIGKIENCRYHIIKTAIGVSQEKQNLTGYKLILYGTLNLLIEYTVCDDEQSVYSLNYNIPFSTFVSLPRNYIVGSKIDIEGIIEDIYNKKVSSRVVFVNTTILINVKIKIPC